MRAAVPSGRPEFTQHIRTRGRYGRTGSANQAPPRGGANAQGPRDVRRGGDRKDPLYPPV